MRELVAQYLSHSISRRRFVGGLTKAGLTATAAQSVLTAVTSVSYAQGAGPQPNPAPAAPAAAPAASGPAASVVAGVKPFQGPGGAAFAEQLIACGVKYVFGNSASEDAQFYEALVDRPQLKYILTPHEGPGAAMAAGYIKASGEPAIVMQAAVVGMANAIGQMFNAFKEQTPLVVYSYRTDQTRRAGRDGFEEVPNQEQIVQPITKYSWLARRADMIPETVRRGFKAAWTPPYGPAYISWHSDFNDERVRTEIIAQELVDPRMRVRPNPDELQRAAKLLVEARMPLMVVGDEIYKTKATAKAVKLAEMLGMPVTQVRQLYANFPETHPLWVGNLAGNSLNSLNYPKSADVIINVGNKFQHNGPTPLVPRGPKFIDMRIDHGSMGNVMLTEVPLVCDVGYGLDDLIAAVEQLLTPALRQKAVERTGDVRKFSEWAKSARAQVVNNPDWDQSPIIADRLTWEIAKFADPDAIIVHEAGSVALHSFDFNPIGGRELFFYYGAHLGSGVGTAAGVKLARPNQQVICLVGDGSFIFGPTALWNMARLELPVITVVYNNHAYGGPHSRVIANVPG
ncbi:MAG: thiamine pyrophosphate-binding protein, partial [Xanthobacteraceae bacterium]